MSFFSCNPFYLKSILSDISILTPTLFWILFHRISFSFQQFEYRHTFTFKMLCHWISNKSLIVGWCVSSLMLTFVLSGKFNSFTFKIVTDKKGLTSVIVIFVLYILYSFLSLIPVLLSSFVLSWFFTEMFEFLFHFL